MTSLFQQVDLRGLIGIVVHVGIAWSQQVCVHVLALAPNVKGPRSEVIDSAESLKICNLSTYFLANDQPCANFDFVTLRAVISMQVMTSIKLFISHQPSDCSRHVLIIRSCLVSPA